MATKRVSTAPTPQVPQKFDLQGAIAHTSVPTTAPLVPLFEAIDNAIDAVRERTSGRIVVEVVRKAGTQLDLLDAKGGSTGTILGFRIRDEGIGFTDAHVTSFMTRYSRLKSEVGGKGLGRFAWFKTFAAVEIESHYVEGDRVLARRWKYEQGDLELRAWEDAKPTLSGPGTTVFLQGFDDIYEKKTPRRLSTIAYRIFEHFFARHVLGTLPPLAVEEEGVDDAYDASETCESLVVEKAIDSCQLPKGHGELSMTHLLLRHHADLPGGIAYCAKEREVEVHDPSTIIEDVPDVFTNNSGDRLSFRTYVSGPLLEANASQERTSFRFDEGTARQRRLYTEIPTWAEIREALQPSCEKFLRPHVAGARRIRDERVDQHLDDAPWYRGVLAARPEVKSKVPLNAGKEGIEMILYKETLNWRGEVHERGARLLEELKTEGNDFDNLREELWQHQEKLKTTALDDLARYVGHRKAVLQWLERYLEFIPGENKHVHEAVVHDLFFRRGKDSTTEGYFSHNLWILDDQLTFHQYAASDKALASHSAHPIASSKEPDVAIYSGPGAVFTEQDDEQAECRSVVIVEFKRPGRTVFGSSEDPVHQVRNYAKLIATGTKKNSKGRLIEVSKGTRYFGYIIADKSPDLLEFAEHYSLGPLPNGSGWARFFSEYEPQVYVEMYTYSQALATAKRRNAAFFHLAGLRGSGAK